MAARSFDPKDPIQWVALRKAVGQNDFEKVSDLVGEFTQGSQLFLSSASSYKAGKKNNIDSIDFGAIDEGWKDAAIEFYNTVPEAAQVVDTTAKSIALCQLRIGFQNFEGDLVPVNDDPELSQLLRRLEGPSGDYHSIMHAIAVNYQVTGDGFLIAEPVYDSVGTKITDYENWEFISVKELSVADGKNKAVYRDTTGGVKKYNYASMTEMGKIKLDENYYIARGWRRSPWHSQLSDSAIRKNLTILKLIRKFEDLINAIANSQLSAGILLVPDELSFGAPDETITGGGDVEDQVDPLTLQLVEYLSLPTQDRSSSASLAPLVFRGKGEHLAQIQHIRLGRDMDVHASSIREELLDRLAMGMDAPKEIMMGKSSTSAWTGSNIDSQFATSHVIPLGQLIADFLTRNYLWPMMRKAIADQKSKKSEDDIKRYRIMFDPANIVARVDKATLALRAYEKGIMSESSTLRALGFTDADARNASERRQDLVLKLIAASPVTLAPCLVPLLDGLEHVVDCLPIAEGGTGLHDQTKPVDNTAPDTKTPENPGAQKEKKTPERGPHITPEQGKDAEKYPGGKDEDPRNPNNSRLSDLPQWPALITQIATLAHSGRVRAIEKSSNKILSAAQGNPELKTLVKGKESYEVVELAHKTGADGWVQDIIKSMFDEITLKTDVHEVLSTWFETNTKLDAGDCDLVAELASNAIAEAVGDFIIETAKMSPSRFGNSLLVPDELIEMVISGILNSLILDV